MAPSKFSIVLDNPVASYFPGQVISGKIILDLDQEKNTQGLKLKFNGESEVIWHESHQSGSKGFQQKESYFYSKLVIIGDEKNSDVIIPAGQHEFPFSFELPLELPSSFESEFGRVRYGIEAVVKRSWKFDYSTKIYFTVNALVDLNLHTTYFEPKQVSKEKSILCLCCKEGPISMKVELPRIGYVPGESINFSVFSSNSSSRPVSAIAVYFIMEITYHAQGRSKSVSEEIIKIRGPEVLPFQHETWQGHIQIPSIPPSGLGGCKLIELTYVLKFKLDIPSSIDLKKKLPIFIGTIPYTSVFQDLHSADSDLPSTTPFQLPVSVLSKYSNLPLPIYQNGFTFKQKSAVTGNEKESPPLNGSKDAPFGDEIEHMYQPKYVTYGYQAVEIIGPGTGET